MNVNDTYYQAQMYRHGTGLDYGCEPRATQEEAEQDLRDCLGMMSEPSKRTARLDRPRHTNQPRGGIGLAVGNKYDR